MTELMRICIAIETVDKTYSVFSSIANCFILQLVWARTYAVGCGALRCEELRGAEEANENALFLVCDYGPG